MGKKYIIELESGTHIFVLGPEGIVHIGESDVVYETVDGMQIGDAVINAKPYAEPDLEQVRKEAYEEGFKNAVHNCPEGCPYVEQAKKEAYQKGYETGYEDGYNEPGKNQQEVYQRGLADAWEAARKIWQSDIYLRIFKVPMRMDCFTKFSVSEAIEKLKAYEQEKEEQIQVGDEVENTQTGVKFIVTHLWKNNRDEQGVSGFNQECSAFSTTLSLVVKTGRHFPEIAAVLEKMRGEQDG